MARVTLRKSRGRRRYYYGGVFFVFLLAATGIGLYRLPPSLQDIDRIFRLAADKIFRAQSADITSAEPVLRGTVYDSRYRELAVSYRLYSVQARQPELTDRGKVVRTLSEIIALDPGVIEDRLARGKGTVMLAENLLSEEAEAIRAAGLAGVQVVPEEVRYYPENETAAAVIGYTGGKVGLTGIEGFYDLILQHGEFKEESVPELDFAGEPVLGRDVVDVILTLELDVQAEVEKRLRAYLARHDTEQGLAVVMHARTGAILAAAGLPSFNPNYFWQAGVDDVANVLEEFVPPQLYDGLVKRATAIHRQGEAGFGLPPETIAAEGYGVGRDGSEWLDGIAGAEGVDTKRFIRLAGALLNGGWLVKPHLMSGVYDHGLDRVFGRSAEYEKSGRLRLVPPAMGIRLRREAFSTVKGGKVDLLFHVAMASSMDRHNVFSNHRLHKLFVGGIPATAPQLVLVMMTRNRSLYPSAGCGPEGLDDLQILGGEIMAELQDGWREIGVAGRPPGRNAATFNRFLISRRVDFRNRAEDRHGVSDIMPELTGLSLRKGLQKLSGYQVSVRVEGSGRIVNQVPRPGTALEGVEECVLQLESRI